MASINFNPFDGWFEKPQNGIVNLLSFAEQFSQKLSNEPNFAAIKWPRLSGPKKNPKETEKPIMVQPEISMMDQYEYECKYRPNHRHAPELEKVLENEAKTLEKEHNPTKEELEEIESNPLLKFLRRAEEISDDLNADAVAKNKRPYHFEDWKLWRDLPNVIGLDGRPVPRKSIYEDEVSDDKFWDFTRQFFFGLWGFKQRPYPPGRPIDFPQAFGYKKLDDRYYDFAMKTIGYFYKDRLGRTRGPMELVKLRTAWGIGMIDKDTFIWMEDMDEWAPISMVNGLEAAVATWDVRLGAAYTAFCGKLKLGIPPWAPVKGREKKTYLEMQQEAIESKKRDLAVLKANDGVWPGVRTPSHAMFLWASGTEMTPLLDEDHMPNKFIPKKLRMELAKVCPDIRPWEVIDIEQAMDRIVFNGKWFREPLSTYTTGPPYLEEFNEDVERFMEVMEQIDNSNMTGLSILAPIPYFWDLIKATKKARKKYYREVAKKRQAYLDKMRGKGEEY